MLHKFTKLKSQIFLVKRKLMNKKKEYGKINRTIFTLCCRYLFEGRCLNRGFPGSASSKEPVCRCRRRKRCWFDPWAGKISGERNGNLFHYSCLENPMDREACYGPYHHKESDMTKGT